MTSAFMDELLHKIGWTESTKIPLSNAQNAELEAKLEELSLRRHKASVSYENEQNRFNALTKHLKYLKQESEQNQQLIAINKQQLESDKHNFKLKECEREKFRTDIKRFKKEATEHHDRSELKKNHLTNAMAKIEKAQAQYEWDIEAAKAWEDNLKKRDEDTKLLRKFSKQDEKRAKELEAKRMNLQVDVNKRKEMIEKMVAEITNYEQIMERTAKMANQLKEEKKSLVVRWQDSVRNLRQRDLDIDRVNGDLQTAQEVLLRQKLAVDEQNAFLKIELRNNEELAAEIQELNETNSQIRRELNHYIDIYLTLQNDMNTLKRAVVGISHELEKTRAKSKMVSKDIDVKSYQITLLDQEVDNLYKKLEETKNSSGNASERAKYLEDIIEFENKQTNVCASELTRMQNSLYRTQLRLEEQKESAKLHEMEIQGFQVTMNILQRTIAKNNANLEKVKEQVYDLDFRKCNVEMKLSKIEGTVTDDLQQETVEKIRDLQSVIAQHNDVKYMLDAQITRMNDERRRLTNTIAFDQKVIEELRNKLQNFLLLYQGGLKQIAAARTTSQKKQVEENVLRLKVDNLSKGMAKQEKNIYNLQKFRLELDTAMTERKIEIETHKEVLLAKKKNIEEELARLRMDIMGRNMKIKQLQSRYDVAISLLGKDESGETLSITHYKIKNAQEKYMLQIQGDELDQKIKTAEKEIVAMENTLKVVNYSNDKYKAILAPVGEHDQEIKDMQQLNHELQDTTTILRARKKVLKRQMADVESFDQILETRKMTESERYADLNELKERLQVFLNNMEDNKTKIKRAKRHISRTLSGLNEGELEFSYKDFGVKMLQNSNFSTMLQLRSLPKKHPETLKCVVAYFNSCGLHMRGSVIRTTGSSFSEEPVMSICSSTSSEGSRMDYSIKPHVTVSDQKSLNVSKIKLSTAKLPEEEKKKSVRLSVMTERFSTLTALYKLTDDEKKGKRSVTLAKSRSSLSSSSEHSKGSQEVKVNFPSSSDDSMRIPSSLCAVPKSYYEEEEEEEEMDEDDAKAIKPSPSSF